jgi:hypothetical protein
VKITSLAGLRRQPLMEAALASLPQAVQITAYARSKAFKINEIVRELHEQSFEWYGFTLAHSRAPEIVVDVGLPRNAQNLTQYTSIEPEAIAAFQETLPPEMLINGWLHSHGDLELHDFSSADDANQLTVLDYVTAALKLIVAKQEIPIKDLKLLVEGRYSPEDLALGSVSLITEAPVAKARLLEAVMGGFCYSMVIGDAGWTRQEIYYKRRGVLTGQTHISHQKADLVVLDDGRELTHSALAELAEAVKRHIHPSPYIPPRLENM